MCIKKIKWRGTVIVLISTLLLYFIFYQVPDRSSESLKFLLCTIFLFGFGGGCLAFYDSYNGLFKPKDANLDSIPTPKNKEAN